MTRSSDGVAGVLIDDHAGEREDYARILTGSGLTVRGLEPSELLETVDAVESSLGTGARVVVLDYRLDEDPNIRYRGGSLAASIRERLPDLPLVLLTTEAKLEGVEHRAGIEDLFDWRVLKHRVATEGASVQHNLVDLARGYHRLAAAEVRGSSPTWQRVAAAMSSNLEEIADVVRREVFDPASAAPAQIARWLLHAALNYEGVLASAPRAQAICGLSRTSFESPAVQDWLMSARYVGVFSTFGTRYWAERLRTLVADASRQTAKSGRASALSELVGMDLEEGMCNWCGRSRVLRACSKCQELVDATHALVARTHPLPAWADAPVVCFRCISEGRCTNDEIAAGSESIVESLQTGELSSPLDGEQLP